MFKTVRVLILLAILAIVAAGTWRTKTNSVKWQYTLPINIYPINGDGSAQSEAYLRTLVLDDFKPIETFMQTQAAYYGHASKASIEVRLGKQISTAPPPAPMRGGTLETVLWSLQMRWWAWRHGETSGPGPQVKMYLLYFDPGQYKQLAHSTALQKGLIGRVNVFATPAMARQNNVVIAHEFLHTLGATDKYDLGTQQPLFPDGYAEPRRVPLLPQSMAEIMAGRTPTTESQAEMPASLKQTVIGKKTAQEINWIVMQPTSDISRALTP